MPKAAVIQPDERVLNRDRSEPFATGSSSNTPPRASPQLRKIPRLPGRICLTGLANQLLDAGQPDPVPLGQHQLAQ